MPEFPTPHRSLRLGVAGPVGTGKSSLIAMICRATAAEIRIGVITNDIYTDEDARLLRAAGVLEPERIRAIETGACPHTAIRDDVTANLAGVEDLEADFDPLDLVLVESGGDNLTATFSPALIDAQIFVLDVAGGGDVARKGGPGIGRADLLVVNKTDLAPYVGVDVEQMISDAEAARDGGPVLGLSRTDEASVARLRAWLLGLLEAHRAGAHEPQDPGPMAPHFHADEDGGYVHSHDEKHGDGGHSHGHEHTTGEHSYGAHSDARGHAVSGHDEHRHAEAVADRASGGATGGATVGASAPVSDQLSTADTLTASGRG